MDFPHEVIL